MAGWLHGVFVGDWIFDFPLCGFSLSLFCNYLVWVSQVDAYLTEKFPYSAHLFKTTADERKVQIEWEVPGNEAADVDSRAARFVELQQHDEAAKAHGFLSTPMPRLR